MPTGAQRLGQAHIDRGVPDAPHGELAVITAVTAGAGTDGNALVTVTHNGATQKYPYLLSYTPVVGHVVAIHPWGASYLILGRPGGIPPAT
jgi:hypothetical protein